VSNIIACLNTMLASHLVINLGGPVLSYKALGIGLVLSVILSIIHLSTKTTQ